MNPFLLQPTEVGPLQLRPWTMTTQHAINALKMQDWEEQKQVVGCAWIQSREPREVKKAIADGTALQQIEEFDEWFPLALSKPLAEWFKAQVTCVEEGRVDVIPQPGGRTDAPKN